MSLPFVALEQDPTSPPPAEIRPVQTLADAQRAFYNGRYEDASAWAQSIHATEPRNLAAYELRTSALLFQIRRAIGEPEDKDKAFKACAPCADLMALLLQDLALGQTAARAILRDKPLDDEATFFLGKLNLNYVWLQLGTLGRRTGWNEYWEARKSLDAVLKRNPGHVRARVARAWIDYIVDTRMPRGFRWVLGGGDKKKGLAAVRDAANAQAAPFERAEAGFALWDMQVREQQMVEAVATARRLSRDFPDNRELTNFITKNSP